MERDTWAPFDGEVLPSQRITLRQRMAQLAMSFMEGWMPADLGDVDEEETA